MSPGHATDLFSIEHSARSRYMGSARFTGMDSGLVSLRNLESDFNLNISFCVAVKQCSREWHSCAQHNTAVILGSNGGVEVCNCLK